MTPELAALADVLDPLWGRITRISVNPRYWSIIPREIFGNGDVVKVGWYGGPLGPPGHTPGDQCLLGGPADGRRECEHRPGADRDRTHDGGTGRRHFLV
ncbi:DUF5994 family protein [Streptomyces sp. NEAU-YJ-81]|uniref:DUF5994 family protein n=1 Tax=Streptomyces sp. NEAU-YJ-81 TaxID=2820288 RepID=UPI001ABCDA20|nr:hypothetical protein [Streptomyces sp. NEAU-YJ-81]